MPANHMYKMERGKITKRHDQSLHYTYKHVCVCIHNVVRKKKKKKALSK